ncbi:MAG: hypothetical protein RLZZ623_2947, partial [Actinomycetota bacterium]
MPLEPSGALRRFVLYAAATLVPVVGLGVGLSVLYTRQANEGGKQDGTTLAQVIARSGVEPFLEGHSLTEGLNARERYSLMKSTGDLVAEGTVLRLRVRDTTGQVMFDAQHPTAPPGEAVIDGEVIEAASGTPVVGMTTVDSDVVDGSKQTGISAIEVYLPIFAPSNPQNAVGVLETYVPYAPIAAARETSLRKMQSAIMVGLAALWLVLAVIVFRTTRRIQRQSEANQHLALHDAL